MNYWRDINLWTKVIKDDHYIYIKQYVQRENKKFNYEDVHFNVPSKYFKIPVNYL